VGRTGRYHKIGYSAEAIDRLLVDLYMESHAVPPTEIVLDLDATDIPLYGHQPERFFHGYYDSYCYLPLYIFAGDQLLCARLRPADKDAAAGAVEEVSRIVTQLRRRWPEIRIVLRADSGFCRESVDGLVRNRTMSIMSSGWRATSGWRRFGRSPDATGSPVAPDHRARPPASSPSSLTRPTRAGRAHAAWC